MHTKTRTRRLRGAIAAVALLAPVLTVAGATPAHAGYWPDTGCNVVNTQSVAAPPGGIGFIEQRANWVDQLFWLPCPNREWAWTVPAGTKILALPSCRAPEWKTEVAADGRSAICRANWLLALSRIPIRHTMAFKVDVQTAPGVYPGAFCGCDAVPIPGPINHPFLIVVSQ